MTMTAGSKIDDLGQRLLNEMQDRFPLVREPFAELRAFPCQRIEQAIRAARLGEPRAVDRHAAIGAPILLQNHAHIAAIEQMQLDRTANQPVECRRGAKPHPQPERRIGAPRLGGPGETTHIMLAASEEQRVTSEIGAIL